MEARLDAILKRVGRGMAHYADEVEIRGYILKLEARIQDAETRKLAAQHELTRIRATLRGPGKAAYVVFVPDDGDTHNGAA